MVLHVGDADLIVVLESVRIALVHPVAGEVTAAFYYAASISVDDAIRQRQPLGPLAAEFVRVARPESVRYVEERLARRRFILIWGDPNPKPQILPCEYCIFSTI